MYFNINVIILVNSYIDIVFLCSMKKLISAAEDSWVRVWHLSLTPETNSVEVKTTHRQKQRTTLKLFYSITPQDALN